MILQALVKHYEDLVSLGKLPREGWSKQKIAYALDIDENGQLLWVTDIRAEKNGKFFPQLMELPLPEKHGSAISPNFLWDNSSYILGIDKKDDSKRTVKCFNKTKELYHVVLENVDSPVAQALILFFDNWNPETAAQHPNLQECIGDITSGVNLVFRYDGSYVHENPQICNAWQQYKRTNIAGIKIRCIVTGEEAELARLHPLFKGISGAQPSGAALVSYNEDAFCSYQKKQGGNAPTGEYAAFAYGAALNYLIEERKEHPLFIGDAVVLCWAEGANNSYCDLFDLCINGDAATYQKEDIETVLKALIQGKTANYDGTLLDPERPFYVLAISPNAGRLSVRFFMRNSFGKMLKNVAEHQNRLAIIKPKDEKFAQIPLWVMLNETVRQNSSNTKKEGPVPVMAGEVLRAILNNTLYPATLLHGVILRIRADHRINRNRAAIIKAYYLKNPHPEFPNPEEVFTVSLNPDCPSIPYQLGRLFAVLEEIQNAANPNINTTIKDKYYNSASATPATIFPILENLSQKHLRKLPIGNKIRLDKMKQEIMMHLNAQYPARLTLPEQGAFQIGYYHQTQTRFAGKKTEE